MMFFLGVVYKMAMCNVLYFRINCFLAPLVLGISIFLSVICYRFDFIVVYTLALLTLLSFSTTE